MSNQEKDSWEVAHELAAELPAPDFHPSYESKLVTIEGSQIHYMEKGAGDPIVFIHGNPESSYIWRNVMPYLEPYGRVIAPDLIGFGKSDKPKIAYEYEDFYKYLDGFYKALNLQNMTFVIHDWGSVLGFDYARQNRSQVRGIAYMEGLIMPAYPINDPEAFRKVKPSVIGMYERNKSAAGEDDVLVQNLFIEKTLPGHTFRKFRQYEMDRYREPFKNPDDRLPLLQWPKLIPINGKPESTHKAISAINEWLLKKEFPTLHCYGEPGDVNSVDDVQWLATRLKNHETAYVGVGLHFIQEDRPKELGRALADWYRRNLKK
ncbi:MAG: haloalkane dehalogenase [Prochloraceae cyanobacterium]|nr:haloalkane dehalogenase [Prochloraceae cyanobacterium]